MGKRFTQRQLEKATFCTGNLPSDNESQTFWADGAECCQIRKGRYYVRIDDSNQFFDPYKSYPREPTIRYSEVDQQAFGYFRRYMDERSPILFKIFKRCQ